MEQTIIHLVDDDSWVREALSRLLRSEGYEVRAFGSAADFLDSCLAGEVECLLLDIAMPGIDGLELQRLLNRSGAMVPIVFLTGHGDIPMTVQAVKSGAVDFLTKPVDDSELLRAIKQAVDEASSTRKIREKTNQANARFNQLTPREKEVMAAVVAGKPNKIIAAELGAREQTVKVHRGRVMTKMAAESLVDLVRIADRITMMKSISLTEA
ncbi:response regulator transcription factor [Haloferula chungangensis]|uniref:Response regulator transcription factor n=1 Tax=Haloferula chungangensis TaxID=1048331 RepID=A0ABW2L4M4_9BACT